MLSTPGPIHGPSESDSRYHVKQASTDVLPRPHFLYFNGPLSDSIHEGKRNQKKYESSIKDAWTRNATYLLNYNKAINKPTIHQQFNIQLSQFECVAHDK